MRQRTPSHNQPYGGLMSGKATIATLTAALMAAALAPAGVAQAAEQCPAGTQSGEYCSHTEEVGVTSKEHKTTTTSAQGTFEYTFHCTLKTQCKGTLDFEGVGAKGSSASVAKSKAVLYATYKYSIGPGATKTVTVRLNAAGRKALASTGKLTVQVVAVSGGKRKRLGTLTIKAHKAAAKKHSTHARKSPGFTG